MHTLRLRGCLPGGSLWGTVFSPQNAPPNTSSQKTPITSSMARATSPDTALRGKNRLNHASPPIPSQAQHLAPACLCPPRCPLSPSLRVTSYALPSVPWPLLCPRLYFLSFSSFHRPPSLLLSLELFFLHLCFPFPRPMCLGCCIRLCLSASCTTGVGWGGG